MAAARLELARCYFDSNIGCRAHSWPFQFRVIWVQAAKMQLGMGELREAAVVGARVNRHQLLLSLLAEGIGLLVQLTSECAT